MGNEQSSGRGGAGSATNNDAPQKTDYYELLGVERQATDVEIKKAYRKKALELHPDRNYGDIENATVKFAEVQSAYEVLSDAQERSWYDSHRDSILRGADPSDADATPEYYNIRMTTSEELYNLIGRFNKSVPFTDAPTGFFGILAETFDSLAQQEVAACDWDGQNVVEYPSFGSANDDFDTVAKPFYKAWTNFETQKSFGWKNKWRLSDAPDRRVRRLMEKENKKLREDTRAEFSEAVRSLVAFVRKRDPRYVPNTQSEVERAKILRDAAAAQAARSRAANQDKTNQFVMPEWAQSRGDDNGLEGEFSESEDESEVEVLECVVCNKTFKTEKQYEVHEKSKKHAKAVQQLRWQMKKENAGLDLEEPSTSISPAAAPISKEYEVEPELLEDSSSHVGAESRAETEATEATSSKATNISSETETDNDDYVDRAVVEERLTSAKSNPLLRDDQDDLNELSGRIGDVLIKDSTAGRKLGKAKAKREKRAAKQTALDQQGVSHKCAVCNETFNSKTNLFNHLKAERHAAPLSGNIAVQFIKPGKSGKNRK
ncbi:uncharacterized protein BCR38DRAFT_337638 [Pseudomassariella vexata]|uniref:DnaJ domain-containing protein n=1 Tax=Pseudomassariella vexata TaxID=1141098 RepID=A0A1Y2E660_9PEZI|nr:uncharacterized protein BCR38DRAFT_337638 [Pseudomassariella vexata]ORY67053.1 hypothetical protein BCR38DRAFT_337638 [Pseudomassariella vexata]